MSIMDFFRGAPAPAPQNPQAAQPGQNPPPAVTPQTPQSAAPATPEAPKSPLDPFADLWKIDDKQQAPGTPEALFNIDPAKLQEAASKTDFSQVITQDTIQRMTAGGEDAVKAFVDSMNKVAQATYAQSAMASAKIVEQALTKAQQSYDARIPGMIKQLQVSDNLRNDNPVLNNPAISPLISAMELQFTQKFPNASASEITKLAQDYILGIATTLSPQAPAPTKTGDDGYDWNSFLK